jgi:hypothetical protein
MQPVELGKTGRIESNEVIKGIVRESSAEPT